MKTHAAQADLGTVTVDDLKAPRRRQPLWLRALTVEEVRVLEAADDEICPERFVFFGFDDTDDFEVITMPAR